MIWKSGEIMSGGELAVAVKKELLKQLVRDELAKKAEAITKFVQDSKLPAG